MKYGILVLMVSFVALSTDAYGHGDEKHKKPEKVSSAMMHGEAMDTTHHEEMEGMHDEQMQTPQLQTVERDFETIRAEVQSSTTFIVIKASALAVAIVGLGVVYLPRKRKANS